MKRRQVGGAGVPSRRDRERWRRVAEQRYVLTGVYLDLETQGRGRDTFGIETVNECNPSTRLVVPGLAQPRIQSGPQGVHSGTRWLSFGLHEINVLRVARRRCQVELVKRRPAPESEGPGKKRIREYLNQCAAYDQILFNLGVIDPGCVRPPFGDVVSRNHASGSTLALTYRRQSWDRATSLDSAAGISLV